MRQGAPNVEKAEARQTSVVRSAWLAWLFVASAIGAITCALAVLPSWWLRVPLLALLAGQTVFLLRSERRTRWDYAAGSADPIATLAVHDFLARLSWRDRRQLLYWMNAHLADLKALREEPQRLGPLLAEAPPVAVAYFAAQLPVREAELHRD